MKADGKRVWTAIFAALGMGIIILDAQTALSGAREGLELCIRTVIPSLFPFFVLSILLTGALAGSKSAFLAPVGRLCGLPRGTEPLLLVGLLGGYPVGAQCIAASFRAGQLSRDDARRMLGFCSNAGPAFIFGMAASLFQRQYVAWILWGIHILSALLVGAILPGKSRDTIPFSSARVPTLPQALASGIRVMASVCGWVILFRVLIAFMERWFLWLLPKEVQIALIGFLELSNGCCELIQISAERMRFVLCACILSFGGLCVAMQTISVTGDLGTGAYFPGKVMQSLFSFILAAAIQPFLFPAEARVAAWPWLTALFIGSILLLCRILKNKSRNPAAAGV